SRIAQRYLKTDLRVDPLEIALNDIVLAASLGLLDAKKDVAIAIADEKRLMKQTELESASALEWARRATEAEGSGNPELAREARRAERAYTDRATSYRGDWERQRAEIERLKKLLRRLTGAIERATWEKNRIMARRRAGHARRVILTELHRLDETVRTL